MRLGSAQRPSTTRRRGWVALAMAAAIVGVTVATAAADTADPSVWTDLVGTRRAPTIPVQRVIIMLRVAPAILRPGANVSARATRAALADQRRVLARLTASGIRLAPTSRFILTINAVAASISQAQRQKLERSPDVTAIYPDRMLIAEGVVGSTLGALGAGVRPITTGLASTGTGVTVALLDGPIDAKQPMLAGRLDASNDTISAGADALHATALASIIAGANGPAGLTGVAPGARILAVQALYQAANGTLVGTTETLLRGLERAADPNGDGGTRDHARVVLAALGAPFAGFAASAEAQAIANLSRIGVVVVVPAGNDGATGSRYGTLSALAAAPDALTVAATDGRVNLPQVAISLSGALNATVTVPLASAFAAPAGTALRVIAPPGARGGSAVKGLNGQAVLLASGGDLAARIRTAAAAGAAAVIITGNRSVPAGALGLDDQAPVPVVAITGATGQALTSAAAAAPATAGPETITFGAASYATNPASGAVAVFSSTGLSYDDALKPDLAAPGVTIAAAAPQGAYATATGTSVAAAQAAGVVADLAAAHRDWSSAQLRSAVIATAALAASASGGVAPVQAQGGGVISPATADQATIMTAPTSLSFGVLPASGGQARARLTLLNTTARPLTVTLGFQRDQPTPAFAVAAAPSRFVLAASATATLPVVLSVPRFRAGTGVIGGWLVLSIDGAVAERVPLAVATDTRPALPIQRAGLAPRVVKRGSGLAATLTLRLGAVTAAGGHRLRVVAVRRLAIRLYHGQRFVAEVWAGDDLLPGVYRFSVRALDPAGGALAVGSYRLVVAAVGADDGRSAASFPFRVAP